MTRARVGDPGITGLALFGFSLVLLGVQLVVSETVAGAALYAVLAAGIAETIAGFIDVVRGQSYSGSILATFGIFLLGFFFYLTNHAAAQNVNPDGIGAYFLALLGPILFLAIPAFKLRIVPMMVTFVALASVAITFGLGNVNADPNLTKAAGWLAWAAALPIWYSAAVALYTHTVKAVQEEEAHHPAAPLHDPVPDRVLAPSE